MDRHGVRSSAGSGIATTELTTAALTYLIQPQVPEIGSLPLITPTAMTMIISRKNKKVTKNSTIPISPVFMTSIALID